MKRTRLERVRLGLLFSGAVLFFALAIVRLGQFQIVNAAEYSAIVDNQSSGRIAIPAERGMVYDRYGRVVAKSVVRQSLYSYPKSRQEMRRVADYLEDLFDLKSGSAISRYRLSTNRFRWIKRHLDDRLADRLADEAPAGLYLRTEPARQYPYGTVGKQILGFTNIDNVGLSGFELSHDSLLTGQRGWADYRRDGLRKTYRVQEKALVIPVPGKSVVLTIDWQLQEIVEEELARVVEKYNAVDGMAAFVDCATGQILSLAHFDPEAKNRNRPSRLAAVTDQFEPGSSFKPFTAAALLDAGAIKYSDTIDCEMGRWKMGRRTLHDDKELGWLNFRRIIEMSSNIGLAKCAVLVEGTTLMDTYRKFGFGQKSGLRFPGETRGRLATPSVWSDYNVAAIAMGHSIAVNTLQMASAMAAIANGGKLYQPSLVLGYVDHTGRVRKIGDAEVIGQPIKESSSDSLRSFLRGVVENGTGYPVNSEFVSIAGKTGTAEIPNLESGGYYKHRFMASFCGFFPAEKPVVAGIVVLKNPKPVTYGGHTSGRAFRQIAERYSVSNPDLFAVADRICPTREKDLDITIEAPDFIGRELAQIRLLAEREGVKVRTHSESGRVLWQYPAPDRLMLADDEILLAVTTSDDGRPDMSDLKGLTIRRASAFLDFAGIKYDIEGSGRVTYQSIRPGESLTSNTVCRLRCRPI
jgi:cell division protein FtsI/penicillin-binding protein 2